MLSAVPRGVPSVDPEVAALRAQVAALTARNQRLERLDLQRKGEFLEFWKIPDGKKVPDGMFKNAYDGLPQGVMFVCFMNGCECEFPNTKSGTSRYHTHAFKNHCRIPADILRLKEDNDPERMWPVYGFQIFPSEDLMLQERFVDLQRKNGVMTCTSTSIRKFDERGNMYWEDGTCGEQFKSTSKYWKHQTEAHDKSYEPAWYKQKKQKVATGYWCHICQMTVGNKQQEQEHYRNVHSERTCCGQKFKNSASLDTHKRKKHPQRGFRF